MNKEIKYKKIMDCLDKWMQNREEDRHMKHYLDSFSLYKVAVYGYGMLGKHAYQELKNDGVDIRWVMDKNITNVESDDIFVSLDQIETVEAVDAIIVTPIMDIDEVSAYLRTYFDAKIISIEEIVEVLQSKKGQK